MVSLTVLITYFMELLTSFISFLIGYLVIKRNKENQNVNKLLSVGVILVGLYTFTTFIYSIIAKEWAIKLFISFGMSALLIAVLLLYFTMRLLIDSSARLGRKEILIYSSITSIIILIIIFSDFITVLDEEKSVTSFNPFVLYTYALFIMVMLIHGSYSTYIYGIKHSEGRSRKRMIYFFWGLITLIIGLITESIGNFFPELELLFDLTLFSLIAFGMLLLARVFLAKRQESNENKNPDK